MRGFDKRRNQLSEQNVAAENDAIHKLLTNGKNDANAAWHVKSLVRFSAFSVWTRNFFFPSSLTYLPCTSETLNT